jgi:DNA polymerase III subunit delta
MSKKPEHNFYLLHGDDDMSLEITLKELRGMMGSGTEAEMNTSEYEGEDVSVAKILNDVRSFPFLSDKRLVIVKGLVAHLMKNQAGKDQLETLLDAVPNLPAHARLVLVERENLKSNLRVVKLAQEKGYCKQFTAPEDISDWIKKRAKTEYQAEIDMQAARALSSVTGNDLRRADNELVKLVSYVDGKRSIMEADVALLTPYVAEASVFDMVDALAVGNGKTALSIMTQVLDADPADPGFRLFSLIVRQFRLLILAREYLDGGGSANENAVAQALGMKPYPAGKLANQARRFTLPQLEMIYRRLQQYDVEMKTGKVEPRLALELLVASLAK